MAEKVASLYAEIGADTSGLKRGLQESKTGLQDLSRSAPSALDKLKTGLTAISVAAGITTAAIFALKKVFYFAEQGAELEYIEGRFDRLAESIGTTGDALKNELRQATKDTISDMQLMAGAGDLMALGLAKSSDEAVRLATVVAGLGMNMNQLVLTLTNQTTMRFDALGVAVDGFDEKVQKLKASGMDANEAFKQAFLLQAEEQLAKVGNKADTTAGSFDKLAASLDNLKSVAQKAAGDGLAPVADTLGDVFGILGRTIDLQQRYNEALDAGIITEQEKAHHKYGAGLYFTADAMDFLIQKTNEHEEALRANSEAMKDNRERVSEYYAEIAQASQEAVGENLAKAMADLDAMISGNLGQSMEDFRTKQMELSREAEVLRIQIEALSATNPTSPEQLESLGAMQLSLFETNQAIEANAAAHEEATKRILFNLLLQRAELMLTTDEQRVAFYSMATDIAKAWGLVDESTANAMKSMDTALLNFANGAGVGDTIAAINSIGDAAAAVSGDYYIRFNLEVVGSYPEVGNDAGVGVQIREVQNVRTQSPNISKRSTGTYSGSSFTGGGGGGRGSSFSAPELPGKTALEKLFDTANAAESLGSFAATSITKNVIDPLKQELEGLDKLMGPGFVDLYAMENMVALERRRAEAAEKLAIAEKQVLEFRKQQEKLGFLEQQVKLLDMIREYGLDAGTILGDLKLGANADMGKVLEAMTRALEGKIGQIETQMGIVSPGLSTGSITQPTGTTVINNTEITMDIANINSMIDWYDAANRLADIWNQRLS